MAFTSLGGGITYNTDTDTLIINAKHVTLGDIDLKVFIADLVKRAEMWNAGIEVICRIINENELKISEESFEKLVEFRKLVENI